MNFQVPEYDSSITNQSSASSSSYQSIAEVPSSESHNFLMTERRMSNSDIDMVETVDSFDSLPLDVKQRLMAILNEQVKDETKYPVDNRAQDTPVVSTTRSVLPKWNGNLEDFGFYICRLEARIKREWASSVDPCSICLDMIDTLPEDKKPRIAAWFQERSRSNNFSWKDLIEHFHRQFDDKEARQSASEYVNRMEQGYNQLFLDFLKDFEYHIAPCSAAFTPLGKSMQLKASMNNRLRKALIGLKLPPLENYDAWVKEVCEVAADLEGLNDYRSKNAKYTTTKLGAPKGINVPEVHKDNNLDADGDFKMGGTNALLTAFKKLGIKEESLIAGLKEFSNKGPQEDRSFKNGPSGKPRASWRSEEEFYNLIKKGLCTRCKKSGHKSQYCRKFGPPIRPKASVGAMEEESDDSEEDSGKEDP